MAELAAVIQSLEGHPSKQEVEEMIREVEFDENGNIDMAEFLNIMGRKMKVFFYINMHSLDKLISAWNF